MLRHLPVLPPHLLEVRRIERRMAALPAGDPRRQTLAARLLELLPRNPENGVTIERPDGEVEIDPAFDAFLGAVARHVESGELWNAPIGRIAERVGRLWDVEVHPEGAGLRVVNHGDAEVAGLSVRLPGAAPVHGAAFRDGGGHTRAWFDLPAGAAARVVRGDGGWRVVVGSAAEGGA